VARPGELVTLTVQIEVEEDSLADVELKAPLVSGLIFEASLGDGSEYLPEERAVRWQWPQAARGETRELQFQVRMGKDARDLMTQRIELRATGYAGPAVAEVVVKRLFPAAESRITPEEGGEVRSADGRVRVIFPAGAVTQPLRVEHRPVDVGLMPARQAGMALTFELNAVADDGTAVHRFAKPLELQVDLSDLVDWGSMPYWQNHFLGYLDPETGKWEPFLAERRGEKGGVLVAQIDHFSTFGGGTVNVVQTGWLLAYNDANVSTFNGGLSYTYPIKAPEGRGGLTPDLALSYNSRRVDGILSWIQADWVGLGWTLDTMEIVRKVNPDYTYSGGKPAWYWGSYVHWENEFTLMYKGTGYKLLPGSTYAYGRYYCEEEQFLYVERRNNAGGNGSSVNDTSEYWVVRLRDGTEYRLGYNEDSEQTVTTTWYTVPGSPTESTYAGKTSGTIAFRWRVDRVLDHHTNKIENVYVEENSTSGSSREKASYLSEVRYNWVADGGDRNDFGTKITLARAGRNSDGIGDTGDPNVHYFYQDSFLTSIKIENWNKDSNQWNTVREYDLSYDRRTVPIGEHDNRTRRLDWIKEYGTDGIGGDALPTTDLGYDVYDNKAYGGAACDGMAGAERDWCLEQFRYERLTNLNNGYGGTTVIAYEKPADEDNWFNAANYRVNLKTVNDGRSGGHKLAYAYPSSYSKRCYDSNGTYGCDSISDPGGSLVGYDSVTETLKTISGANVAIISHEFKLNTEATATRDLGREWKTRYQKPDGTNQRYLQTTWYVDNTLSSPTRYFVYAQLVHEWFPSDTGALTTHPKKVTEYAYETDRQGNGQYGNLTKTSEYQGDGSQAATLYRRAYNNYYPNTASDKWIVDKLALTNITDQNDTSQTKTKYTYDDTARSYTDPPLRGDVVKVEQTVTAPSTYITVQTITYNDSSYYYLPSTIKDGNNRQQEIITYDAVWKMYPTQVTNDKGLPTTYAYDYIKGVVTQVTGPNGASTAVSYEYDDFGRLTKVIRPGDSSTYPTTLYEYCDTCSPLKIVTKERVTSGQATTIPTMRFYDGLGRLIQQNQGPSDGASSVIVSNTTYNAQGQAEYQYMPYTASFSWNYITPDTGQPKTTYAYDALGRITQVTNTDSTTVKTDYNALRKAVRDEKDHKKIYTTDALGRLTQVKEFTTPFSSVDWSDTNLYATTGYAYNRLDLLTQVTDAASNNTYVYYDALGRKTQMTDPDMGTWYYKYDNASNLLTQVDARANAVCTYYDEINRVKGKNYVTGVGSPSTYACPGDPGSYTVAYTYDAYDGSTQYGKGYRTGMADTSGSASWKYDTRGRVKEESKVITGGGTFKTQWTFNARDLVLTQIYPGGAGGQAGETVTSGYDVYGRPITLTGTSNYVTGTDYTAEGRIDLLKLGNTAASPTLKTDYVYYAWTTSNGRGRLQQLKTGTPSVTDSLQDLRYSYDAVGNVTQVQDYKAGSPETMTYTYDDLDRLTAASGGYSDSIAYNTIGNITSKTGMGNYAYQDGAHKHAVTHLDGVQKYWYDANGNMTSRTVGSSYTLTYDVENRLTGVSGGASATFTYDGDGNRVKGVAGGVTTCYVGNYYEYGSTVKKYYYHTGKRVAMHDGATLNWLLGEHLGSTTITANSSGTRTGEIRYKAYGASRYTYGTTPTTYHFTGQREESTIGLYHYGARWYDPALGRFVQADPIVPGTGANSAPQTTGYVPGAECLSLAVGFHETALLERLNDYQRSRDRGSKRLQASPANPLALNRYAYTFNNPVRYTDPTGHNPALALAFVPALTISTAGALVITGMALYIVDLALPGREERHAKINASLEAVAQSAKASYDTLATGVMTIGQAKRLPRGGEFPYIPQEQKGNPDVVRVRGGGFVDKVGNIWKRDKSGHAGSHWDVQLPDGSHVNVDEKGKIID